MNEQPSTKNNITDHARSLFARHGYDGFTMRSLAKACDVSLSSIYHYFEDKDVLLKSVYDMTNTQLGVARADLALQSTATEDLRERIKFQFDHAEEILFVLRFYLHFRTTFVKQTNGYLTEKAYRHISEVLQRGVDTKEFYLTRSVEEEAKVIAHSINGFVLEYFPESPTPDEYNNVVDSIHSFMVRSLTNKAAIAA